MFQRILYLYCLIIPAFAVSASSVDSKSNAKEQHLLYVAEPGIRDDLKYGGHGILVFDIDHGHRFVRRIPSGGTNKIGKPLNVKGVCASQSLKRLYVSTIETLMSVDLANDELLWEKRYEGGCDRMAMSPDGKTIYLPSLEKGHWHIVDANSGDELAKLTTNS